MGRAAVVSIDPETLSDLMALGLRRMPWSLLEFHRLAEMAHPFPGQSWIWDRACACRLLLAC